MITLGSGGMGGIGSGATTPTAAAGEHASPQAGLAPREGRRGSVVVMSRPSIGSRQSIDLGQSQGVALGAATVTAAVTAAMDPAALLARVHAAVAGLAAAAAASAAGDRRDLASAHAAGSQSASAFSVGERSDADAALSGSGWLQVASPGGVAGGGAVDAGEGSGLSSEDPGTASAMAGLAPDVLQAIVTAVSSAAIAAAQSAAAVASVRPGHGSGGALAGGSHGASGRRMSLAGMLPSNAGPPQPLIAEAPEAEPPQPQLSRAASSAAAAAEQLGSHIDPPSALASTGSEPPCIPLCDITLIHVDTSQKLGHF